LHLFLLFLLSFAIGLAALLACGGVGVLVYILVLWAACGKDFVRKIIHYYRERS